MPSSNSDVRATKAVRGPWRWLFVPLFLSGLILTLLLYLGVTSEEEFTAGLAVLVAIFAPSAGWYVVYSWRMFWSGPQLRGSRLVIRRVLPPLVFDATEIAEIRAELEDRWIVVDRWIGLVELKTGHQYPMWVLMGFSRPGRTNKRLDRQVAGLRAWHERCVAGGF